MAAASEFAAFLVCAGIDSISLHSDAVLKTTSHVLRVEQLRDKSEGSQP